MLNCDRGVAYLGNSATAQSESYVDFLHSLVESQIGVPVRRINAGLGGVGSLACAALLDFLVLRHMPSVCFIETSMADSAGATPLDLVSETVCELVDRLTEAGVLPVFVHLPRTDVPEGQKMLYLQVYRECAMARGVAEVDVFMDFPEVEGLRDGIHHKPLGARFAAEKIFNSVSKGLAAVGVLQPSTQTEILFPEKSQENRFRFVMPFTKLLVGDSTEIDTGNSRPLGLMVIATSKSGVIEITDGHYLHTQQVWDEWCAKPRIQMLQLPRQFRTSSKLRITMTPDSEADSDCWLRSTERPDMSLRHPGSELDLVGVVCRSKPASFKGSAWWEMS